MTFHTLLKEPKKLIFITGAAGFLGGHLTVELARKGYSIVALVRSRKGESGADRFIKVCGMVNAGKGVVPGVRVIEGDMNLPHLGLGQDLYHELKSSITDIINCAADTSFTEKRRELVERTNIHGLENLLDIAIKGNCSSFHQVSTAYVFGRMSGEWKEVLTSPESFTNVYEETKCMAEHIASDFCEKAGIVLNIYRPGIVCGESKEGRTFRFNGLYYPLKSIQRIIESFKADLFNKGGNKADRAGVKMVNKHRIFLPLTIKIQENSGINVIPVDYFVQMFIRVMEDQRQGGIFHIVQKENCPARDLIEYTGRYFNIEGLKATGFEVAEGPIERMFNLYNEAYLPYLEDKRRFSSENTRHLRESVPDDRFTYDRFKLCMDYAVEVEWGKLINNNSS